MKKKYATEFELSDELSSLEPGGTQQVFSRRWRTVLIRISRAQDECAPTFRYVRLFLSPREFREVGEGVQNTFVFAGSRTEVAKLF